MIEPSNPNLSIGKQCALLSISGSSFYYEPKGETELNLDLMRVIDKQFLETPFYGVRQMTWHLRNEGYLVNEKRIRRLMRRMGLMPIYQKPIPAKPQRGTKSTPTCCVAFAWIGPIRSGALTLPICQCDAAFCIWLPLWTGTPARFWLGASQTHWRLSSASML